MSQDDSGSYTQIKPTPGGRGHRRARGGDGGSRTPPGEALSAIRLGVNPVVRAAYALLMLAPELRKSDGQLGVENLFERTADEVRRFESSARKAGVPDNIILLARYVLCVTLDEAALSRSWSARSNWKSTKLSIQFHNDNQGGENLFKMLDQLHRSPGQYLDVLELIYLCLSFGFQGEYQLRPDGYARLEQRRTELYETIRQHRDEYDDALSSHWEPVEDIRSKLSRRVPLWMVGAGAVGVLAALYFGLLVILNRASDPVFLQLAAFGQTIENAPTQAPPEPRVGISLASLLNEDIGSGVLDVQENAFESTVTLHGDGLFASGSTDVGTARVMTIKRIAWALNKLPGDVIVTGHTDDVPIRTMRFPSNFELSIARAEAVARALARELEDPGRLSADGLADASPIADNGSAQGRAQNRRVEIELRHAGVGQ